MKAKIRVTTALTFVIVSPTLTALNGFLINAARIQDPNATLPSSKPKSKSKPTPKATPARKTNSTSLPKTNGNEIAADETALWNSISASTNPKDFQNYLDKYPNGNFVTKAKDRLKELESKETDSNSGPTEPASIRPRSTNPVTAQTVNLPTTFKNEIGIEFVLIQPGRFIMGSDELYDEKPTREVAIRYGFYLGKYEVTQEQWKAVMGKNPSYSANAVTLVQLKKFRGMMPKISSPD